MSGVAVPLPPLEEVRKKGHGNDPFRECNHGLECRKSVNKPANAIKISITGNLELPAAQKEKASFTWYSARVFQYLPALRCNTHPPCQRMPRRMMKCYSNGFVMGSSSETGMPFQDAGNYPSLRK